MTNAPFWPNPLTHFCAVAPRGPVLYFAPAAITAQGRLFRAGFPGLVTYAVKANPEPLVIEALVAADITTFDVASPAEIALIKGLVPGATLHYNNPVRSRDEIEQAVNADVASYSVDSLSELEKLCALVPVLRKSGARVEIAARFKLPVAGASYDFGSKFGTSEELAAELLRRIAAAGYTPALTFHPGTQCTAPAAWESYITAAARIARAAGVRIARLNVGGGFPAHRLAGTPPDLAAIFSAIRVATKQAFGLAKPDLVCEPGRALVAEAGAVLAQVKAIRDKRDVFLNDGVYGLFAELPIVGMIDRIEAFSPTGQRRHGARAPRDVFGPTCDSVDRLPGQVPLPADLAEGDYLLFHGMGAYSSVTATRFNGYGDVTVVPVHRLTAAGDDAVVALAAE